MRAPIRGALAELGSPAGLAEILAALVRAAVVHGARELLWSKALACESGSAPAAAEWRWWAERLEEAAA